MRACPLLSIAKPRLWARSCVISDTQSIQSPIDSNSLETGLNPYDVRLKCDPSEDVDGPFCYRQVRWIDNWMNDPVHKAALGVNPDRTFEACSTEVNKAFTMQGDSMHNSAALLPELVDAGVRLLVYAGNAGGSLTFHIILVDRSYFPERYDVQLYGMLQNFFETNTHLPTQGNERWVDQLPTRFLAEFQDAKPIPWVTTYNGRVAGEVRSAGGQGFTAGNVTFVNVYEAGYASVFAFLGLQCKLITFYASIRHMVPYDQPEAAFVSLAMVLLFLTFILMQDLITRWVSDIPLSITEEG